MSSSYYESSHDLGEITLLFRKILIFGKSHNCSQKCHDLSEKSVVWLVKNHIFEKVMNWSEVNFFGMAWLWVKSHFIGMSWFVWEVTFSECHDWVRKSFWNAMAWSGESRLFEKCHDLEWKATFRNVMTWSEKSLLFGKCDGKLLGVKFGFFGMSWFGVKSHYYGMLWLGLKSHFFGISLFGNGHE